MILHATTRTQSRPPGRTRVTGRDLTALQLIARLQPVQTDQVRAALGCSTAVARRRLRVLRAHGLCRAAVLHLATETLHLVTARGIERLVEEGLAQEGHLRVLRDVPAQLDHHIQTARLLATLSRACEVMERVQLLSYQTEREIRATLGAATREAQIPDAVAVLQAGPIRVAIAVESDTGSENPSVVARKLRAYATAREADQPLAGQATWGVVVLVPTERRLHRVAKAALDSGVPDTLVFQAVASSLTEENVLRVAPWRTVVRDEAAGQARLVPMSPFVALLTRARANTQGRVATTSGEQTRSHQDNAQ